MYPIFSNNVRAARRSISPIFRPFYSITSLPNLTNNPNPKQEEGPIPVLTGNNDFNNSGSGRGSGGKGEIKVLGAAARMKQNWLQALTYPIPSSQNGSEVTPPSSSNVGSQWVIGVDPDLHGALALLKTHDDSASISAQVFDSPHLKVPIGKRIQRRLDTKAIVQLLQSFDAPTGTIAYIEQSIPFPQDGKQGWWCGGYVFGLWIGVLVASGFSVVPVPSLLWKNKFKLSGNGSSKDNCREVARTLFPSASSLLTRKRDHGRAEALLIAAYGKGLKLSSEPSGISEDLTSKRENCQEVISCL